MRVLITAGATRNPIDAIRYLSASATGRTGAGLAEALMARGAQVCLLGSAEACLRAPKQVPKQVFGSTQDLLTHMQRWIAEHPQGAVVHSAAVGDYAVAQPAIGKVPSKQSEWVLKLVPTPNLADQVRGWGCSGVYVTFKAAPPHTSLAGLTQLATAQRTRTGCDLVFANVLGRLEHQVVLVGEQPTVYAHRAQAINALIAALCVPC